MADLDGLISTLNSFIEKIQTPASILPSESKEVTARNLLQTQAITFEPFDEASESFENYSQRLENFLKIKGLLENKPEFDEARVMILINCLGSKHYQLLSSLTAPDLPSSRTYNELMKLLQEHLSPKKNILTEQHKFLSRTQKPGESISNFVTALKQLSKGANFKSTCNTNECAKSIINLMLRAQFIRGLEDSDIREKILQQSDLDFDKTLDIALAIEASKIENREMYKSNNSINKVTKSFNQPKERSRTAQTDKLLKQNRNRSESRNRKNLNFKDLKLERICLHCGKGNHPSDRCRIKNKLMCEKCHKTGHLGKICITSMIKSKSRADNKNVFCVSNENSDDFNINRIENIFVNLTENDDRIFSDILIHNKNVRFECDTGSRVTIMNIDEFNRLNLNVPISETKAYFRSYTGEIFKPIGVAKVKVSYKKNSSVEELYVVSIEKNAIVGRDWIRNLKINLNDFGQTDNVQCISSSNTTQSSISNITEKYADVFTSKVGQIPDYKCSLKLREGSKPIFLKPRPVPYALKDEVDKELDRLEKENIIEKVDHSEWGTPLVIVPKPDGSVRICADYKVTVNKQLHDARHPIPRIEDIFNKLRDGSYFCTLDMYKAYLHLLVDEESTKIQTISTHRGTYLAKRLFFGIKSAPNEFHKFIDQFTQDLDGVVAYFDDIIIQGKTYEECKDRLIKVLDKLRANNMHVNYSKCKFFERKVQYLGHIISSQGLQKSPDKIKAIEDAPRPKNVEEVRQFLGLVMYYSKFIENASELLYPLNQLLRKDSKFKWTASCETSFLRAKSEITSDKVLVPFNPDLQVILATDASPFGLSGVLSHIMPDGSERPISFASRSLTSAEKNYSQLDKEATAVYWSFKKFFDYIFGRKFTLIVDNKPMMTILHPEKKLPMPSATRMLRYAHFISNFDYKIQHRRSSEHANADYFSRNPIPLNNSEIMIIDDEYYFEEIIIATISTETITDKEIRKETEKEAELRNLKEDILNGRIYDTEISVHEGILLRGQRVIIPKSLQPAILQELHSTHVGIVKMKALARNYCYWRNIDSDIENIVKSCKECCDIKKNPKKAPIHQWEIPAHNWQRVHMDYAGPFMGTYFFIVVDAKSKWPEIYATKKAPDTASTIHYLREIFSRFGLPEILVSDNATIFKSREFQDFCTRNGIRQRFIAPGHPATNGQAERYCQTLKSKLECMKSAAGTLHEKLNELLFRYRATPLSTGKTPAENLFGFNIRTKLDIIRPHTCDYFKNKSLQPLFNKSYQCGDRVQSRNYSKSNLWKYGTVVQRLGRVHYLVELDDGYVIKRHYDQLRSCTVDKPNIPVTRNPDEKKKTVTFSDDTIYQPDLQVSIQNSNYRPSSVQPAPSVIPEDTVPCTSRNSSPEKTVTPDPAKSPKARDTPDSPKILRRSTRVRKPVQRLNL